MLAVGCNRVTFLKGAPLFSFPWEMALVAAGEGDQAEFVLVFRCPKLDCEAKKKPHHKNHYLKQSGEEKGQGSWSWKERVRKASQSGPACISTTMTEAPGTGTRPANERGDDGCGGSGQTKCIKRRRKKQGKPECKSSIKQRSA